jgi:hypothetical protein
MELEATLIAFRTNRRAGLRFVRQVHCPIAFVDLFNHSSDRLSVEGLATAAYIVGRGLAGFKHKLISWQIGAKSNAPKSFFDLDRCTPYLYKHSYVEINRKG